MTDYLRQGQFRNIPFEIDSASSPNTKKNIVHEYPNSKKRIIEELGVSPDIYVLNMRIFGLSFEYIQKRDELLNALKKEGDGILIHPSLGQKTVKCTEFSYSENIRDISGVCEVSATFYEIPIETDINPTVSVNRGITLYSSISTNNTKLADMVDNNVAVSNAFNFNDVNNKMSDFYDKMLDIKSLMSGSADFAYVLSDFNNNITTYLSEETGLGTGIFDVFRESELRINDAQNRFDAFKDFFNFGDDDVIVVQNTLQREERVKSQKAINTQIQLNSWNIAANAVNDINFDNETELLNAQKELDNQYDKIINSDFFTDSNIEYAESNDILTNMKTSKVYLDEVFKEKATQIPKIINVEAKNVSYSMLCYQYYNSLDNLENVINLNGAKNTSLIDGEVKLFSETA